MRVDVIEVSLISNAVKVIACDKSPERAERIIERAEAQQVSPILSFFTTCGTGRYEDGYNWQGKDL